MREGILQKCAQQKDGCSLQKEELGNTGEGRRKKCKKVAIWKRVEIMRKLT